MTLTKSEMAKRIREQTGCYQAESAELVDSIFDIIKHSLEKGEEVLVSGFGEFAVRHKDRRLGRDPQTGEPMILPSRKVTVFKCSTTLKDRLDGKKR